MKNIKRSFPELILNFWVKCDTTDVLFFSSLSTFASLSIRISLYNFPILAKRANTLAYCSSDFISMSRGKIEITSTQNHPFRYFFAITFLSVIS